MRARILKQLLVVLLVVLSTAGCDNLRQVQAHAANGIAHAANAALPTLVERFSDEGVIAIKGVKSAGGTRAEAEEAVAAVEMRWKPVWSAWAVLRVAQATWATTLESGKNGLGAALVAIKEAYCGLEEVWPPGVPAMPVVPLKCTQGKGR